MWTCFKWIFDYCGLYFKHFKGSVTGSGSLSPCVLLVFSCNNFKVGSFRWPEMSAIGQMSKNKRKKNSPLYTRIWDTIITNSDRRVSVAKFSQLFVPHGGRYIYIIIMVLRVSSKWKGGAGDCGLPIQKSGPCGPKCGVRWLHCAMFMLITIVFVLQFLKL